jgi:radical SAM protein with 4Fe4S-binding SPASM domain
MFSTFELDPYGNIHPCPNLRSKLFRVGNLRKSNYNFKKIWLKENSKKIRNYIKKDNCLCNICGCISYVNIINSFRGVCRWLKILMIKK